jgi:hypothetical protein
MKSSREDGFGHWPRGKWKILREQHLEILRMLRAGVGIRKTARLVGVGVRTVQIRYDRINGKWTARADEIGYRQTTPQRCPVHGMVKVWPCVACQAIAAKDIAKDMSPSPGCN